MGALSIQNEAIQGIQRGLDGLRKNAVDIASSEQLNKAGQGSNLEGALIGLEQSKSQVVASAKVVSAVDDILGTIIDTRA